MSDVFKHITVSSDSDEDEVIYAGLRGKRDEAASVADVGAPTGESGGVCDEDAASEAEGTDEEGECLVSDDALEAAPMPEAPSPSSAVAPAALRASQPSKSVSRENGGEASDADDLDVGPMPLAQRIVIIAVVICLIGAIAYYLAFMR